MQATKLLLGTQAGRFGPSPQFILRQANAVVGRIEVINAVQMAHQECGHLASAGLPDAP